MAILAQTNATEVVFLSKNAFDPATLLNMTSGHWLNASLILVESCTV